MPIDKETMEQLWKDPDWTCSCGTVNKAIRARCRSCGSDGGEFELLEWCFGEIPASAAPQSGKE